MPDIRITPGSSTMSFTSSLNFTETLIQDPSGSVVLRGSGSLNRTNLFAVDGNNGRLFSVDDDLSNSLFSVNTISGLPVIEAFADNTVKIGQYGRENLIISGSTTTVSGSLTMGAGNITISNPSDSRTTYTVASNGGRTGVVGMTDGANFYVTPPSSGNLYLGNGTTTYINSNVALHAGNYNSYAPTLTGTGATGNWGINITGKADTVTVNSGNTSAAWYPIVWHSGNNIYSSAGVAEIYPASGYARFSYINTTDNDESSITRFVIKNGDNYHRSATTTVAASIIRGVADGTWGINVTGTARKINIGSAQTITDLNISTSDGGSVMFDTFQVGATNKPATGNNANGVITFTMNHGPQYGKQIAFIDSDDLYIRRLSANSYASWLTLLHSGNYNSYAPTLTGTGASGTWGISITGNAVNLGGLGYIQSTSTGTSYQYNYQVRENSGGGGNTNEIYAPQLAFHWSGVVASSIMMESSGRMAIRNNPGSAYESFIASTIYGTGDVIAYASDFRLKENIKAIENPINKLQKITGVHYDWKEGVKELGFTPSIKRDVGVIAQDVQAVLPEAVKPAPFDYKDGVSKSGENYLTVQYEKIVPLLIEAIKEQQTQIDELKQLVKQLTNK